MRAGMCCGVNQERDNGRSETSHPLECWTDTMDFALSEKRQMMTEDEPLLTQTPYTGMGCFGH